MCCAPVDADAAGHEGDQGAGNEGGAYKDGGAVLCHAEAAGLAADADGPAAALTAAAHLVVLPAAACDARIGGGVGAWGRWAWLRTARGRLHLEFRVMTWVCSSCYSAHIQHPVLQQKTTGAKSWLQI